MFFYKRQSSKLGVIRYDLQKCKHYRELLYTIYTGNSCHYFLKTFIFSEMNLFIVHKLFLFSSLKQYDCFIQGLHKTSQSYMTYQLCLMFKKPIKVTFKEWNSSRGYTTMQPVVLIMQNTTLDYFLRLIHFSQSTGYFNLFFFQSIQQSRI